MKTGWHVGQVPLKHPAQSLWTWVAKAKVVGRRAWKSSIFGSDRLDKVSRQRQAPDYASRLPGDSVRETQGLECVRTKGGRCSSGETVPVESTSLLRILWIGRTGETGSDGEAVQDASLLPGEESSRVPPSLATLRRAQKPALCLEGWSQVPGAVGAFVLGLPFGTSGRTYSVG